MKVVDTLWGVLLGISVGRFQPQPRGVRVQDAGVRLCQYHLCIVPLGAFQEEAVHVDPAFRRFVNAFIVHFQRLEPKLDLVDGKLVLSGKVLLCTCQEGVREEEGRQPEECGDSFVDPFAKELDTPPQVLYVPL